jgi:hypothetical protein
MGCLYMCATQIYIYIVREKIVLGGLVEGTMGGRSGKENVYSYLVNCTFSNIS